MEQARAANLLVHIDPQRASLQRQIYDGIRQAILDGVVRPGTRLLSSRVLATELSVSRTTVILALEQLQAEGYLTTHPGSGTFVAPQLPDDLPPQMHHRHPTVSSVSPLASPPHSSPSHSSPPRSSPPHSSPSQSAPPPRTSHPPLSRRGRMLAATPPSTRRIAGPPRPFRIGVPALDLFPRRLWSRLTLQRARSLPAAQLDYGDVAGLPILRQAIADYVSSTRGTRCSADQVIVVAGAQQGLDGLFRLLLDPGDAVWIEDPAYPGARSALLGAGARVLPVRVDGEGLDVEAGMRRAQGARLAYVTPSHQFPLGVAMSLRRRRALLDWASAASAWVVEDDYECDFRYGTQPMPCLHGLDRDGRVIYVGSFSKSVFPALRLGFLVVPPDLHAELAAARSAAEVHPPVMTQAVLADFMLEGHFDRHVRRMRAAYSERLEALVEGARQFCGGVLRVRPVQTGLHAVADLEGVDAEALYRQATAMDLELTPLAAFHAAGSPCPNAVVLGFAAVRPAALTRGMERLAAALEAAARS